ncbi:hypothetical protein GCM10025883_33070 [Mobilicoccus caccae]|uniref:Uncharacterized protein n=1 Tax=Mobilicoccus caccae TaxID=1859295 RepID=A0ABQ6ITQ5_9MICO|nr:hypothetical protein GCM10025883_33070 [Mobilicoccus caccae]
MVVGGGFDTEAALDALGDLDEESVSGPVDGVYGPHAGGAHRARDTDVGACLHPAQTQQLPGGELADEPGGGQDVPGLLEGPVPAATATDRRSWYGTRGGSARPASGSRPTW